MATSQTDKTQKIGNILLHDLNRDLKLIAAHHPKQITGLYNAIKGIDTSEMVLKRFASDGIPLECSQRIAQAIRNAANICLREPKVAKELEKALTKEDGDAQIAENQRIEKEASSSRRRRWGQYY